MRNVFKAEEDEFSAPGLLMLAVILVLLSAILVVLVIHILLKRRQLRIQEHEARAHETVNEENDEALSLRIQRRYETIEGWMISKRVLKHDDFCRNCVHSFAAKQEDALDATSACSSCNDDASKISKGSYDDLESSLPSHASSSRKECPICLDSFRRGQIITYSPNPECSHVFHHECIKEWLLRHTNCPFCRNFCMHTDLIRGKQQRNNDVLGEYLRIHSQRSATTLFCEKAGLLSIPSNVNCTEEEFNELISRIRGSVVDRMTLTTYRRSKPGTTTASRKSDPDNHSHQHTGDELSARERALSLESVGPLDVLDVDDDDLIVDGARDNLAGSSPQGVGDVHVSEHISFGLATVAIDSNINNLNGSQSADEGDIDEKPTVEISSSEESVQSSSDQ